MDATGTKTRISIKNILYPTDFSPAAEAALPYAIGLATRYGAKVHALHAIEATQEQAKLEAQQLHKMLATIPHEVSICEGDIWPLVNDMVEKQKIDMIVIGTSGRTGISRAMHGSVSEEIFRRASCAVLTVGPHISGEMERRLDMKEILYATDFSSEALAALPYAISMAQEHQARLTLLHVVGESKTYVHLYGAAPGEIVQEKHYADSVRHWLHELMPPESEPWCEPKYMVLHGPEADKIIEAATTVGADLIVLGVRGAESKMTVATHLGRPIAHRVVTQARCPVLTVRV